MLLNTIPVFKFAAKIGGCAEKQVGKLKKVQNFPGLGGSNNFLEYNFIKVLVKLIYEKKGILAINLITDC